MKPTLLAALLLLAPSVAFAQTTPDDKPAAPATSANLASMDLIKPGAEPRSHIRFAPAIGSVYTIRVAISLSAGVEVNGTHLPAAHTPDVTVVFHAKALEAAKPAGTRFELEFADTQVVIRTGATHEAMDATREYFESLKSTKIKFVIFPSGEIQDFKFQPPTSNNWMVRILGQSMMDAFLIMIPWIPQDEIGQGAQWRQIAPTKVEGEPHSTILDNEWASTEKDAPHIRVNMSSTWQAANPKTPKTAGSLEWQSMKASGSARYVLAAPSPFPSEFESKIVSDGKALVILKAEKGVETAKVMATVNMRGSVHVEKPKSKS
jgi:hypothetical protein